MASLLPIQILPLTLILLTVLAPAAAAVFNISSLSGLLSPVLTESLLVALPPCHLTGGNATLMVRRANDSKVVKSSFVVPPCRGRRELVSVVDSGAGFTVTRLSAYQVTSLAPGTKYYISYLVKKGTSTESSREIPMSTLPLARYKLRVVEPPKLPVGKKPTPDKDGPDIEPNLWMWVNPNIVFPPGKLEAPQPSKGEYLTSTLPSPQLPPKEEDLANCSEAKPVKPLPPSPRRHPFPTRQFASPSSRELTEEEEAKDQDDSSSAALLSPHKRAPLQSRRLRQANRQEGRLWSRPPLNYFHLIALALRNGSPCGLNVQQIYSFTRQHFPFFRTAPEGWKNTIRHNLCFRDSFEKVPVSMQGGASAWPRSCLWKLTEEGHRRFEKEARALASTQLESIQQCMSQPDVMPFLFDL
ncbi:PREDICTED: forkhead box protein R1-like [Miniopterus natalensis]|uniref:forkhead box protein R1-like n=1 Tax=Miniopterus natalensis TaxID=291302 RepID=UPI0007A7223B|nr:PREDICTED: forkhead box protein R1-like [Miniopterus natalensis]